MMDQLLDVSVAQGEAEIQPNRVLIMCGATRWRRYESKAIARGYPSRSPVSVKIPAAQLIVPAFPPAIELWRERDQWFEPGSLRRRVRRNRWLGPLCRAPISSASRDSAYPARGSTHSRRVQGAHLALAATRGNRATRGGAPAARNCVREIALPGGPRTTHGSSLPSERS
jgi:hypothetical protein